MASSSPMLRSIALVTALALGTAAAAEENRLPVPERAARRAALAAFKKEFRTELKIKGADEKRTFAEALLEQAAADDDTVRRYVYTEQAALQAAGAKDVGLTMAAIDRLAAGFEIERASMALKAVNGIARGSKDVSVLSAAATTCIDLAGDAVTENDGATAGSAIAAAKSLAKKAKMGGIAARAGELAKLVASFKRLSASHSATEAALTEDPADRAAHTAAGRHASFGLGDFDTGRVHFVAGDDDVLRALAENEGKLGESPELRNEVARGWWDAAQSERDPLAKARMLAHAAGHYRLVLEREDAPGADEIRSRLAALTYSAWDGGVALTTDFSKYGPVDVALATLRAYIAKQGIDTSKSSWRTKLPRFPDVAYAPGLEYFWRLETNHGEITIRLFADTAPEHVTNFLYLTELGFFDGLTFHRVIPGFMAQGGDPVGSGSGGPGYFFDGEYGGGRKHSEPGTLSMANTGQPKSDGSQFFITFRACPELDGKHTVFGEVTDGMKVVEKLEDEGTPGGPPKSRLVIERATSFVR
jgi:cyclophilin family peptidyl-prolyl cis-trans isomerase